MNIFCRFCVFYRLDTEDVGTCSITDNIVEAAQEACNDYRDEESDHNYE